MTKRNVRQEQSDFLWSGISIVVGMILILMISMLIVWSIQRSDPRFFSEPVADLISAGSIAAILANDTNVPLDVPGSPNIQFADNTYYTISDATVREFLRSDHTDRMTWVADGNDCDDFATMVQGNMIRWRYVTGRTYQEGYAFGVAWGRKQDNPSLAHAFNFYIRSVDHAVMCLEPQNDRIVFCNDFGFNIYWFYL